MVAILSEPRCVNKVKQFINHNHCTVLLYQWPSIHDHWTAPLHLNENVVNLMKFSSPTALDVVKMTTSSAASDENFTKMTTFQFQYVRIIHDHCTAFDTLRPTQEGRHSAEEIFESIFLNENYHLLILSSLKFAHWCQININHKSTLVSNQL